MALTATVYTFAIDLADVDRGVYESLAFKAAQQPSETDEYLIARILAYCLEYREGITFSRGLAEPEEPTIAVRDLTGAMRAWIEVGSPDAERLHKASKAAPRVAVYTHKDPAMLSRQLQGARIHRKEELEIHAFDRSLIDSLVGCLTKRMRFALSITEGHLYITIDDVALEGTVTRHSLP